MFCVIFYRSWIDFEGAVIVDSGGIESEGEDRERLAIELIGSRDSLLQGLGGTDGRFSVRSMDTPISEVPCFV